MNISREKNNDVSIKFSFKELLTILLKRKLVVPVDLLNRIATILLQFELAIQKEEQDRQKDIK
jgi:hypothetical protein